VPVLSFIGKSVLYHSGALALLRMLAGRPRAVILRYHSVSEAHDRTELYLDHSLTVSSQVFERQMRFVTRHYTAVPLAELVDRLRQGQALPKKAVAVTFDDGYRDNYTRAFPILRRYHVPATFYLTTGCIENRQILWTAYLRYILTVTEVAELRLTQPESLSLDLTRVGAKAEAFRTSSRSLGCCSGAVERF
jgi:hypothetical protein